MTTYTYPYLDIYYLFNEAIDSYNYENNSCTGPWCFEYTVMTSKDIEKFGCANV